MSIKVQIQKDCTTENERSEILDLGLLLLLHDTLGVDICDVAGRLEER